MHRAATILSHLSHPGSSSRRSALSPIPTSSTSTANPAYDQLPQCDANYLPLTPLHFLTRTAQVFGEYTAAIDVHTGQKWTWEEVDQRCRRFASILFSRFNVGLNTTVSILCPNSLPILESHFFVGMCHGVVNTLNTRLHAAQLSYMLNHAQTRVLVVDQELFAGAVEAIKLMDADIKKAGGAPRSLVLIQTYPSNRAEKTTALTQLIKSCHLTHIRVSIYDYETLMSEGDASYRWSWIDNEWRSYALNYTSGTTGNPKGVVYSHRGCYIAGISNIVTWNMPRHCRYLWTLPLFHCNGWTFPWTITALAGIHILIRQVRADLIYQGISQYNASHFSAAPTVLTTLLHAQESDKRPFQHQVRIMTAAAPPPAAVLKSMKQQGFEVLHVYGLTEVYGPAAICEWKDAWDANEPDEKARLHARQGVRYLMQEEVMVADADTMKPVLPDGTQMGEIFFRGNMTMKGYLGEPKATEKAFAGGWFHTGDLAVVEPDGYIKIKDRSKDIIISGGENISSQEVENVICLHEAVMECAVVGKHDQKWGEVPVAFVDFKPNKSATREQLINHCKTKLAGYATPKHFVFGPLAKTSTGKVQKFKLRDIANALKA